jgi:hypothetical protein
MLREVFLYGLSAAAFYRSRVRAHHSPAFPTGEDRLEQIRHIQSAFSANLLARGWIQYQASRVAIAV